ncbi:hypothetical protein TNCV_341631 [Trichonephila clavipes]|nr:hypothetical protein TNCV_341631 [Trichonephila clavipes]
MVLIHRLSRIQTEVSFSRFFKRWVFKQQCPVKRRNNATATRRGKSGMTGFELVRYSQAYPKSCAALELKNASAERVFSVGTFWTSEKLRLNVDSLAAALTWVGSLFRLVKSDDDLSTLQEKNRGLHHIFLRSFDNIVLLKQLWTERVDDL